MNTQIAKMYGILIGTLGIVGLFVSGHLLDIINVDMALDGLRLVLAAALLYAGFVSKSVRTSSILLIVVGVLYVGMAGLGLFSPTLGGLLPSGLTGFDIAFHLVAGTVALYAGVHRSENLHARA